MEPVAASLFFKRIHLPRVSGLLIGSLREFGDLCKEVLPLLPAVRYFGRCLPVLSQNDLGVLAIFK